MQAKWIKLDLGVNIQVTCKDINKFIHVHVFNSLLCVCILVGVIFSYLGNENSSFMRCSFITPSVLKHRLRTDTKNCLCRFALCQSIHNIVNVNTGSYVAVFLP